MAKEDIVGGLALAVQKGESLGQAMRTFLNSGYKSEEIQDAARMLQALPESPETVQSPITKKPSIFDFLKNLFKSQSKQAIPQNKPLIPVAETTKKLMPNQNKMPISSVQQQIIPQKIEPNSVPLSQHLGEPQSKSEIPQTKIQEAPKVEQQVVPQQAPQQKIQEAPLESKYEVPKKGPKSIVIIILSIFLFLLVLSLLGVFLFKDSLIGLFNNLF
jgi:hypothetical protein